MTATTPAVDTQVEGDVCVVRVEGDLTGDSEEFPNLLHGIGHATRLLLDLSLLRAVDAAGTRMLTRLTSEARALGIAVSAYGAPRHLAHALGELNRWGRRQRGPSSATAEGHWTPEEMTR
ncbi:MAG TPA: STAS domain-containing protein [Acidimicrobiales bacterium]|nr:STAS domain-containing protein [Acidimicrobiales bacterium]